MLLKKLELENFRQYNGIQSVEFSTDPERNVTLFLGKNTSGKTTLIQAFRWIFYDDCNFTGKRSDEKSILNNETRIGMRKGESKTVRAALFFEHRDVSYEVVRKYEYQSHISGDVKKVSDTLLLYYYDSNGERIMAKGAESKLEEILPESLAEYFFFDGEKIAKSRNPDNVKNSINMIMGLVPLEHMLNHLVGGRMNVEKSLIGMMRRDSTVDSITSKIARVEYDLKEAERNRDEAKVRYNQMDSFVSDRAVEMAGIEAVAKDAQDLKRVDQEIEEMEKGIAASELDVIHAFASVAVELMSRRIASDISEQMKELKFEDKGIPDMTAVSVRHILDRGRCICGADLASSDECRRHVEELLLYLPPESIGTQIRRLSSTMNGLKEHCSESKAYDALKTVYRMQVDRYDELEEDRDALSDRIGANRDADVVKRDYDSAKTQRENFNQLRQKYEGKCKEYQNNLAELKHQLSEATKDDAYNNDLQMKMAYVSELAKRVKTRYESSSDEILNSIRVTLTEVFGKMYHGQRTIEITDDYKVMLNVGGARLDNSKGLDTVQNFAFIATLLKVAKDRAREELNSEAYPLAMDAVFSNTDEGHIKNICKELPKLAEQAVLAIMDKDWAIASQSLEDHVGKKYRIEKISETYSRIVELNE